MLIGIRTDESLNRQSAITSKNKINQYNDIDWININPEHNNLSNAYPIYDWSAKDIWIANGKFNYDYNKLYDLFYQAGLSLHEMRVASPFNDCATGSLKVYKIVEPNTWAKLIGRVNGVNFTGIYGNTTAMGWKKHHITKRSHMEILYVFLT